MEVKIFSHVLGLKGHCIEVALFYVAVDPVVYNFRLCAKTSLDNLLQENTSNVDK